MSEKLCTLRTRGGGGGGSATWVETVLWQNPSPSANFPQTTVTLSDSMNNYTYLGLEFKYSKDSTDTMTYYMKVEDFSKQATTGAGSMQVRFGGVGSITISRYVVKTSDTSITIGNGTQVGGTTTSTTIGIPLQIVGIKKGRVPSYKTVKDFIHAKVFDSGLPEIDTYTVFNNRVTVTEGKIVADAVTHKVYIYFDFTTNSAFGSASDWSSLLQFTSASVPYFPILTANSRQNSTALITDDTSDVPTKQFAWGYATTTYPYRLFLTYGQSVGANEHYIVYGEYTYR